MVSRSTYPTPQKVRTQPRLHNATGRYRWLPVLHGQPARSSDDGAGQAAVSLVGGLGLRGVKGERVQTATLGCANQRRRASEHERLPAGAASRGYDGGAAAAGLATSGGAASIRRLPAAAQQIAVCSRAVRVFDLWRYLSLVCCASCCPMQRRCFTFPSSHSVRIGVYAHRMLPWCRGDSMRAPNRIGVY